MPAEVSFSIGPKFAGLLEPHRYKNFYGGRAGLKSWTFARVLLAMGVERKLFVVCIREVQNSIRDSVHRLLKDQVALLGLDAEYTVTDAAIKARSTGTEFVFHGLSGTTEESIKSLEGADIVWVEEAQTVSESSWTLLIPTVRKPGSEIWLSWNPRDTIDATSQRFHPEHWDAPVPGVTQKVTYLDNPHLSEEISMEIERDKAADYDEYRHVWLGEFRQFPDGAVYATQLRRAREEGRICTLPQTPDAVMTFWDLGKADHTAIWFAQHNGPWFDFIGYYASRLEDLDHYYKVLTFLERDRGWTYGEHYLPHDSDYDIQGMAMTRKQQIEKAGFKPCRVVPRIKELADGIAMVRRALPMCRFDPDRISAAEVKRIRSEVGANEEGTHGGLDALSSYHYRYNEARDVYSAVPEHDWASHGADAFRMFAEGYRGGRQFVRRDDELSERRQEALRRNKRGRGGKRAWAV